MREVLLSECMNLLYESNFIISKPFGRSCFDLIAKKADLKLLIKILKNIDSLSTEQSEELLNIARVLQAVPLIIGSRTRNYIDPTRIRRFESSGKKARPGAKSQGRRVAKIKSRKEGIDKNG